MDELDKQIKSYFQSEMPALSTRGHGTPPTAEEFYLFIMDRLDGKAMSAFLAYLRGNSDAQRMVREARKLLETENSSERQMVPQDWMERVKALNLGHSSALCPHCRKPITPFRRPIGKQKLQSALWLLSSTTAFLASFYFHRYFYQCLALALFCGIKWIMDRRAIKSQILIYKALKDDNESAHTRD